jgi:hypothetical protein
MAAGQAQPGAVSSWEASCASSPSICSGHAPSWGRPTRVACALGFHDHGTWSAIFADQVP